MKKFTIIVMTAALLLTGCSKGGESQNSQSSETSQNSENSQSSQSSVTPQSSENSQSSFPSEKTSFSFKICGPEDDEIFQEDVTDFRPEEDGTALNELDADNWAWIECEGFAYIAEPTGISMNSVQNADVYDSESMTFQNEPEYSPVKYRRVYVGEEFMGLKVKEASASFNCNHNRAAFILKDGTKIEGSDIETGEKYFSGSSASFEGEITMTGYASIAPEDDGYTVKHDIYFVPDNESCLLPVMLYSFSYTDGICGRIYNCGTEDFAWRNEYPGNIHAGNADSEDYKDLDFGFFPKDGSFVPVKITLDNITMRGYMSFVSDIQASIVDIEALEPQISENSQGSLHSEKTSFNFKLCGPGGDEIFQEDVTGFDPQEEGTALNEFNADNWFSIECEGFAYLAEPTGISMNSVQNADIYDTENWTFQNEPENSPVKYGRVYVGEEFMGLKLTEAFSRFNLNNSGLDVDEKYFAGCDAAFEGELTMTGYACMASEDDGYTVKHDISFVPDNESCLLPVMLFQISPKGIYSPVYKCGTADFAWRNEYPGTVNVGNADSEEYADLDFGFFPEDGSYVPVKITINNITMRSYPDFISTIEAQIADIEKM